MFGVIILLAAAIVSGWAATQIWDSPEWPRQILLFVAVLDVVAVLVIAVRQAWGRRLVMILLSAQLVVVDLVLIVAAAILIRDNPTSLDGMYRLILFLLLPGAVVNTAVALLAARSANKLAWPHR